ncbi:(2Fe-2S)-binding protein [Streptomyces roseifaciens]|uniref:(2Fe-2S)-binding protein n=1 Tax=Streptomyces roseifaciens TaxID=1488406 RepID=UPI000717FA30|nr:(2Fe-2S)-binding protein [Streptomyces roseifaciens]
MSDEQRQAHAAGPVGWQPIPRGGEYDEGTTFLQLPPELLAHPGAAMNGTGAWDPLAAAGSGGYTPPSTDSWQQAPAAAGAGVQGQWGAPGAYGQGHGHGQGHGDAGGHESGHQGGYEPVSETSEAHGGVHGGAHDGAYGETYGEGVHVGGAHGGAQGGGLHDGGLHDGGLHDGGLYDSGVHDAGVHDAGLHDGGLHDAGLHDGGVHGSGAHDGGHHDGALHDGALHDGGADPHATAEWPAPGAGSTGQWSVPAAGDDPVDESGEYLVRGAAPEAPAAPVTPPAPWSAQPVDDSWRQSLAAATPAAGTPVPGADTGQWSVPVLPGDAADAADTSGEYARDGFPGAAAESSASALPGEPPAVDATSTFTVPAYVSDVTGTSDNPGGVATPGTAGTEHEPPAASAFVSASASAFASEEPSSAAEPEPEPAGQPEGSVAEHGQEQQPAPHSQHAVHAESFAHPGPAEQHAQPTLPEQFVPPQGSPDAADAVAAEAVGADAVAEEAASPAAPADGPERDQDASGADADPGAGIPEHAIPGPGIPAHDTLGAGDPLGAADPLGSAGHPAGSAGHPVESIGHPAGSTDHPAGSTGHPLDLSDPLGVPQNEHPCTSYVLRVNGTDRPVTDAWIGESLLYVLRERLGLAGAKDGCSQGECGACSVQVDGRLVASCLVPAATTAGAEVRTVEGLAVDGRPSDVQRALAECGAVQCGFCVPGMAMTMHDLLEGNHAPTERETRQAICGNLCRCSGYRGVLDAVRQVVGEREATAAQELQDAEAQQHEVQPDADQARIPHQAGPHGGGSGKATTA